jgi:hypothetical protein
MWANNLHGLDLINLTTLSLSVSEIPKSFFCFACLGLFRSNLQKPFFLFTLYTITSL